MLEREGDERCGRESAKVITRSGAVFSLLACGSIRLVDANSIEFKF